MKLLHFASCSQGTYGALYDDNFSYLPRCFTLEPQNPIIAPGVYNVRLAISPKRNEYVFWIDDVPGHTAVQIHVGNKLADTQGCVLVGQYLTTNPIAVYESKLAFDKLKKEFPYGFKLEVMA